MTNLAKVILCTSARARYQVSVYRTIGPLVVETFEEFQGPALLVFNDSDFSQKDLEGIRKLGIGSKTADPTKTGQFGVGFNAVYNLTDTPAFMTIGPEIENGETICLFDPLQKHLKKHVGTQFNTTKLRKAFPDVLSGFCENELFPNKSPGTVFRFPLRQQESELNKNTVTENEVKTMCSTIIAEMQHMLLFLRSVQKIVVSDISSGNLIVEHSVCVELNEEGLEQRLKFAKVCKQRAKEIKELPNTMFTSMPVQVAYEMDIKDYLGKNTRYFIVQRIGFSESLDSTAVEHAEEGRAIGMLPVGGVAISIPQEEAKSQSEVLQRHRISKTAFNDSCSGRLYCFLPLPGKTGLPVSINGHFVLDRARRGLWKEDQSGYRSAWNLLILSEVVAPAYIHGLDYLRSKTIQDTELYNAESVCAKTEMFNSFFPSENVSDKYYKCLVEHTFKKIVRENKTFFPVFRTVEIDGGNSSFVMIKYRITWSEYQPKCHQFPVCFADRSKMKDSVLILMTKLGLKVTMSTPGILHSLTKAVGPCLEFTPTFIINFLKSAKSSVVDKAVIGAEIPAVIGETEFKHPHNIESILSFCMKEKTLLQELKDLPLLLTNDGYLRCFEEDQVVYCSNYCCLFPKSGSRFVHVDLVSKTKEIICDKGCNQIQTLKMSVLQELIAAELIDSIDLNQHSARFNLLPGAPSMQWIRQLWKLIAELFLSKKESCSELLFQNFIEPFKNLHLIPAMITKTNEHILMEVKSIGNVMALQTFKCNPELHKALQKLKVPVLDTEHIPYVALRCLFECSASASNPVMLLKCLICHRQGVSRSAINARNSEAILEFFLHTVTKMPANTEVTELDIKRCLKQLPLYLTLDTSYVTAIEEEYQVLVIPLDFPTAGLHTWATKTGRRLLRKSYKLEHLYKFLGFMDTDSIHVYLLYILEAWEALPVDATVAHLTYIKNYLLRKSSGVPYCENQNMIINKLKTLEIIPCNGVRKKAAAFYNREVLLFETFCKPEEFPSGIFAKDDWNEFLAEVGLITEVTAEKFIEFAKQVASAGRNRLAENIISKSNVLVSHLQGRLHSWDSRVYETIKNIKFVVPFRVEKRFSDVFPQCNDTNHLICFSGSVLSMNAELCWTRMPLLCTTATPDMFFFVEDSVREMYHSVLGVCSRPVLDEFLKHCQNVCDSLQTLMQDKAKQAGLREWVGDFMVLLYQHLQKYGLSINETRGHLYHTPVIYLPDKMIMVPAHKTVVNILPKQQIFPYLMKVPDEFVTFCNVFTFLGAAENPSYLLYVKVLQEAKDDIGEKILSEECLSEWLVVTAAIDNLFKCLKNDGASDNVTQKTLQLYLPCRNKKMIRSSDIVISDNPQLEKRLREVAGIQYFIDFENLKLNHNWDDMELLPNQFRPKFLTEILEEIVDFSSMSVVEDSEIAEKWETFFHSAEFIQGIIRLLKHVTRLHSRTNAVVKEVEIADKFKNLHVREVIGLKTLLAVKGVREESVSLEKQFHSQQQAGAWWAYFQKSGEQMFASIRKQFAELVDRLTDNILANNSLYVYEMLTMTSQDISSYLNENGIAAYNLPQQIQLGIFPEPGTYIPEHLHHLLDYDMNEISEYEFKCVAFEVEDSIFEDTDSASSYTPVYMYVKIVKKIQTEQNVPLYHGCYKIYTGDGYKIVPYSKIFRFKGKAHTSCSRDLVSTDFVQLTLSDETLKKELYSVDFSLREAWKLPRASRWQAIKRLLLRWHPDRNVNQQELSSRIFSHLKNVLDELRQESSDDVPDKGQERAYPDFSSPAFIECIERIEARGRSHGVIARRFDEINSRKAYLPVKLTQEAKRWQNQAKHDLTKSLETLGINSFNWNCYICHQAAEKSLKAAWFASNANGFNKKTHDLRSLARGLTDEISVAVRELHEVLGEYSEYSKMRYPDNIERQHIPSTLFTEKQAREAHTVARKILDLVEEHYLG